MTRSDRQGNELRHASAVAATAFDRALDALNVYQGDPVAVVDEALEDSPDFAMGHVLRGYLFGLATEPAATEEARRTVEVLRGLDLGTRERSHVGALQAMIAGNWTEAAEQLNRHNADYPRDLLGLQAGHLMDFYRANARNLRDRIARALPHWSPDLPGYPILLGMHAFGLEETGDYARAEDPGRRAVALDPRDCWAHHAVAHVMEMQGRAEDGIGWMIARETHWAGDDNFFKVHNWWHRSLYHLDLGQADEVLRSTTDRSAGGAARSHSTSWTPQRSSGGCISRATMSATAGPKWRRPGTRMPTGGPIRSTTGTR